MAARDVQCLLAAIHPVPAEHGLHSRPGAAALTYHSQVSDVLGTLGNEEGLTWSSALAWHSRR